MVQPNGERIQYTAQERELGGFPRSHSQLQARTAAFDIKDYAEGISDNLDSVPLGEQDKLVSRADELNTLADNILAALPEHLRDRTKE